MSFPLVREVSSDSLAASSCCSASLDNWIASDGTTTPTTSPPSSRGESPEPKQKNNVKSRHARSDTVTLTAATVAADGASQPVQNVCFVGAGFVGGPTAALIAYHNPDITVNVVDLNTARIAAWNSTHLPIHEAGLPKIVRIARDGTLPVTTTTATEKFLHLPARRPNLFFTTAVTAAIAVADIIFICVNTPTKTYGLGAGAAADLGALESATRTIAQHAKPGAIIVEKSTVPCGTAAIISDILTEYRGSQTPSFQVLSNPEFLAEGSAVANLMRPDRILIGCTTTLPAGTAAAARLASLYEAWVAPQRIHTLHTYSSELAKLAANAMLAQRVSSANAISALCEALPAGADVAEISVALGADSRLGSKFLHAGVGFGGSCFEKDIASLCYLARALHLHEVAAYWDAVLAMNRFQRERFARATVRGLRGGLRGKKVGVLGFAFKEGTNDTRNSVAVHVIAALAAERPAEIVVFDPGCDPRDVEAEIRAVVSDEQMMRGIKVVSGWREAVEGAVAVCVLTDWECFRGTHLVEDKTTKQQQPAEDEHDNSNKSKLDELVDGLLAQQQQQQQEEAEGGEQKGPTEMEILELERLVAAGPANTTTEEDPLQRLVPRSACEAGCEDCERQLALSGDKDVVDWDVVAALMEDHSWVFDGRNVVDGPYLKSLGFKVHSIGKGGLWL